MNLVSEDDFNALAELAYNAPELTGEFSEDDFGNEWRSTRHRLVEALTTVCPQDLLFEDCVVFASDWGLSRHIQFEVRNLEFLKAPGLADVVRRLLQNQEPKYEFLLEHDLYLDNEWPDCAVLFRAEEIFAYEEFAGALRVIDGLAYF